MKRCAENSWARAAGRFPDHDFLHRLIVKDVVDRLQTIMRVFDNALICGPGAHLLKPALTEKCGVGTLREIHPSQDFKKLTTQPEHFQTGDLAASQVEESSLDLVISLMSLHMVNDLPAHLVAARKLLKPDGLFLAALPGEKTLQELRACLYEAETAITGGVSPRIIPMAAIRDLGGLLQRAGFALPVADLISAPVTYRNPLTLLKDLRGMGKGNVLLNRKSSAMRRDVLAQAMALYKEKFSLSSGDEDADGVAASFDIIMLTGWAPHPRQQRPLARGSGKMSLAEAVKRFSEDPAEK